MSTLSSIEGLESARKYLESTSFGDKQIGESLVTSLLPSHIENQVEDVRYSFKLNHALLPTFVVNKQTYGETVIDCITALHNNVCENLNEEDLSIYKEVGLLEDGKPTIDLMATVVANAVAVRPAWHKKNTSRNLKFTDNLCNLFDEFSETVLLQFLENLEEQNQLLNK